MTTHESRPTRRSRRTPRLAFLAISGATIAALVLGACTSDEDPTTTPTPTATATSGTDIPTATPFPTGTAAAPSPSATSDATSEASPTAEPDEGEPTAEDAAAVLDQYFSAIGTGNYEVAYNLWRNEGEASGQTYDEFVEGFGETASISWEIGEPGRIDAGAGQRYIEVPVRIVARLTSGDSQQFEGVYVLHHTADIDGATPEQRLWHINSAEVEVVE